jgi:hypothetical protein
MCIPCILSTPTKNRKCSVCEKEIYENKKEINDFTELIYNDVCYILTAKEKERYDKLKFATENYQNLKIITDAHQGEQFFKKKFMEFHKKANTKFTKRLTNLLATKKVKFEEILYPETLIYKEKDMKGMVTNLAKCTVPFLAIHAYVSLKYKLKWIIPCDYFTIESQVVFNLASQMITFLTMEHYLFSQLNKEEKVSKNETQLYNILFPLNLIIAVWGDTFFNIIAHNFDITESNILLGRISIFLLLGILILYYTKQFIRNYATKFTKYDFN